MMEQIQAVVDKIVQQFHPSLVILFSRKTNMYGDITSFTLVIAADVENASELERQIYLAVESDLPYDVVVYRTADYQRLCAEEDSFAQTVQEKGVVLYGPQR